MGTRAKGGTCLATLVRMAIPLCQQAERQCPRTGPGKPPDYPDWMMAVLIMVAVLERKKTKSSQYRFLSEHRRDLQSWLGLTRWPVRSTYFERYRQAHRLFRGAITLQGQKAIDEQVIDSKVVAVDKSLVAACGPLWHKRDRQQNRIPSGLHGVDRASSMTRTIGGPVGVFCVRKIAAIASVLRQDRCVTNPPSTPGATEISSQPTWETT